MPVISMLSPRSWSERTRPLVLFIEDNLTQLDLYVMVLEEHMDVITATRGEAGYELACSERPDLIVMEGTGTAGGLVLLAIRALLGIPYVVSSGDAVGPFLRLHSRALGVLGAVYERVLCRSCAGFVGWTPYLAGRALTLGAPRAMTAPGWCFS